MTRSFPRTASIAIAATATASAIWVALAWRTPTSTYHFAPFIAAVVGSYVVKIAVGPQSIRFSAIIAGTSAAVVAAAALVLASADRLRGPSFWADDGAFTETVLVALAGLVAGFALLVER